MAKVINDALPVLEQARVAREAGLKRFIPLSPCFRGHSLRSSATGNCIDCSKLEKERNDDAGRRQQKRTNPPTEEQKEKARKSAADFRMRNPEKVAAYLKSWHERNPDYVQPSKRKSNESTTEMNEPTTDVKTTPRGNTRNTDYRSTMNDQVFENYLNDPSTITTASIAKDMIKELDFAVRKITADIDAYGIRAKYLDPDEAAKSWLRKASFALAFKKQNLEMIGRRLSEITGEVIVGTNAPVAQIVTTTVVDPEYKEKYEALLKQQDELIKKTESKIQAKDKEMEEAKRRDNVNATFVQIAKERMVTESFRALHDEARRRVDESGKNAIEFVVNKAPDTKKRVPFAAQPLKPNTTLMINGSGK